MKIALISDVHGNYPALKKVLDDAAANGVNRYVFLGDYIFDLPFSNEAVREIMKLENAGVASVVAGNKEGYLREFAKQDQKDWVYLQMAAAYQTYRELSPDVLEYLQELGEECTVSLDSGKTLYAVHYPAEFTALGKLGGGCYAFYKKMLDKPFAHQQFLSEMSDNLNQDEFKREVEKIGASVVVFGHDHMQYHAVCGKTLVVNPGSCGQPLDFDSRASYTILEETQTGYRVDERRVEYDIASVVEAAKESKLYECGKIWCELVFSALKTGRDCFGVMFETAYSIAVSKGETGSVFSNETREQAFEIFRREHM